MLPDAIKAAQQRGSAELECATTSTLVSRKETIEEAQTTGWYEAPYRALYNIGVVGCGKNQTYLVACNNKTKRCATGSAAQ